MMDEFYILFIRQIIDFSLGHLKSKPFIDHVFQFSIVDGNIWFRNYQIINENNVSTPASNDVAKVPELVEIGPRFVLRPIRFFNGTFGGNTLYKSSTFLTPTALRVAIKQSNSERYVNKQKNKKRRNEYMSEYEAKPDELETVFDG